MKNKISSKLTIVNAVILICALLIFCILAMAIFNRYMRSSIKEQLIVENTAAYRIASLNLLRTSGKYIAEQNEGEYVQPAMYNTLADSFTLILFKGNDDEEYEAVYSSIANFNAKIDVENLQNKINESEDGVIEININSVNYFCTMQASKLRQNTDGTMVAVSLIPLSSVRIVNRQYIIAFMFTTLFLVMLSIAIMSIMSSRITKPIVKLTNLTNEYANRNFKNKYIANTNDEIQDLSLSISTMARSIEEQDKQRDKMFRNISHELKTPLTAIYGYAEGVKNKVFSNTDEPLDIIMSESLRIKKLTEDIIYLSKLESHIEVFKFEKHDISDIMVRAIHSIESIAIMNDIDIRFMPAKLQQVSVDEEKLHRAIINILSNCVKYTKDTIDIELNDGRGDIEIVVSDNGSGFKDEDIQNLLSGMTKEKSNGSGIGLSIVNEIVKAHNGNFLIGNNKFGGAIFTIVLKK